jgi:predicted  nucleic acid-binding Zn-ribbon protein
MPHICTRCNNIFESGEDILKGCPVCGWKKFMFVRKKHAQNNGVSSAPPEQIITKAMGVRVPPKMAQKEEYEIQRVKKAPSSVRAPSLQTLPQDQQDTTLSAAALQNAATSQSAVVAHSDRHAASYDTKHPEETQSALESAEGNKLESIKMTGPGTYELNLPSLFERDELIMAVKEGTYFIDLSSAFRKGKKIE